MCYVMKYSKYVCIGLWNENETKRKEIGKEEENEMKWIEK